jgi:hypothetical protein
VERVGAQLEGGKLGFAYLDPFRVFACVQLALNAKAGPCGGGSDQIDLSGFRSNARQHRLLQGVSNRIQPKPPL